MTAYQFHWRDEEHGDSLIRILPERRQNQDRITEQSVTSWLRTILGDTLNPHFHKIYFILVEIGLSQGKSNKKRFHALCL